MKGILCLIFTKWKIVLFCRLLQCLDKGTLRLLSENTRITQFSPDLSSWLLDILDSKNQQVTQVPEIYFFKNDSFLKWKSSCLKWRIQNRGNEKVFHTVIYFIIVVHCTNPSTVIQLMWNYTYTMYNVHLCVFDRLVLYTQSLLLEVCHSKQKLTTGKTSLMTEHFTYLKDKGI